MALAQGCSRFGERVLLVEAESELGGCHKVERSTVEGLHLFAEHGPRIYNTQYRTVERFWKDFGQSLDSLFRPYNFNLAIQNGKTWRDFSWHDQSVMIRAFLRHLVWPTGHNVSVANFAKAKQLSPEFVGYLDKICRFSDGGDIRRYALFELMEVVNQHAFTTTLEPIRPNDVGMIAMWEAHLDNKGVHIMKDSPAERIEVDGRKVITVHLEGEKETSIQGYKCVLAMPPTAFMKILHHSPMIKDAFGNHEKLMQWSSQSSYMKYGSMTFHWRDGIKLPQVDGFPYTDWGIVFIELTRTMKVEGIKTMVSLAITQWDVKSTHLQKTPHECKNIDECRKEVFRQWQTALGIKIPPPDFMTGDNFVKENEETEEGKEEDEDDRDDAFFKAVGVSFLPAQSPTIPNLYQLGCQNGEQKYHFTSMEAAVSNAAALLHEWFPKSRHVYPIIPPWTVRDVLIIVLICIFGALGLWIFIQNV